MPFQLGIKSGTEGGGTTALVCKLRKPSTSTWPKPQRQANYNFPICWSRIGTTCSKPNRFVAHWFNSLPGVSGNRFLFPRIRLFEVLEVNLPMMIMMITDRLMKCDNRYSSHLLPITSGNRHRQTGGREWESGMMLMMMFKFSSIRDELQGWINSAWIILVIIMYDFRRNEVFLSASADPIWMPFSALEWTTERWNIYIQLTLSRIDSWGCVAVSCLSCQVFRLESLSPYMLVVHVVIVVVVVCLPSFGEDCLRIYWLSSYYIFIHKYTRAGDDLVWLPGVAASIYLQSIHLSAAITMFVFRGIAVFCCCFACFCCCCGYSNFCMDGVSAAHTLPHFEYYCYCYWEGDEGNRRLFTLIIGYTYAGLQIMGGIRWGWRRLADERRKLLIDS